MPPETSGVNGGDSSLKERVKSAFRDVYGEHTKTIEREKLEQVLRYLNPSFTQADLDRLFEEADNEDMSGAVAYEDFVDFLEGDDAFGAEAKEKPTTEDDAAETAKIRAQQNRPRRASVSAKKVTDDQVKDYKRPVHEKSEAGRESIKNMLTSDEKMMVLFGHLDKEHLGHVVDAFYTRVFEEGVDIITQGEAGDFLFLIESGTVDIYVARPGPDGAIAPGDRGSKVVSFGKGAIVGELALMYGAPRAATVQTASSVETWVLDATDFKMLLMQSGKATYAKYEGWLSEVELLKSLNHFELAKLADIMQSDLYDDGEVVITQGEIGDKFYILEDGTCAAFISGDEGEKEVKVYENKGDYFGEIALLTDEPRRATVRATGEGCSVASLSKEDFTAVLGPIAELLKDQVDEYPEYKEFLKP